MSQIWQVNTLWQSQSLKSYHDAHLHPLTNVLTKCQPSTPYIIQEPRQDFISKVITARSKVKRRLHHKVAHLQPLTSALTMYQLHTPHSLQDIAWTRFYWSRSLWKGQRTNQGHNMMLHTYTPNQCPYQLSTSYTLQFRDITQTWFSNSGSLWQGQRSNQGHIYVFNILGFKVWDFMSCSTASAIIVQVLMIILNHFYT